MNKLIITLLVCILTCLNVPFAYSSGHEQTNFYDWCGVPSTGLVAWYMQLDGRGGIGDSSTIKNLAGAGKPDMYQGTTANQAKETPVSWKFDGTDDYFAEKPIASGTTNFNIITTSGSAAVRPAQLTDILSSVPAGSKIVIAASGVTISGYKYANHPTGETLGSELLPCGDMECADPLAAWVASSGTEALETTIVRSGTTSIKFTATSNAGAEYSEIGPVLGSLYVLSGWYTNTAGDTSRPYFRNISGTYIYNPAYSDKSAAWTNFISYGTSDGGNIRSALQMQLNTDVGYLDDYSLKQVTNLGASGVTICHVPLSEVTSIVYNVWTTQGSELNPNAGSFSYWIYKPDTSIKGDMTMWAVVRPTDGQPATSEMMLAKSGASGSFGYIFFLDTAGKISFLNSSDGTFVNLSYYKTTNAAFSNGTQASSKFVAVTKSGTDGTVKMYADGLLVAGSWSSGSANVNTRDVSAPFMIGNDHRVGALWFAGDLYHCGLANRVYSAGEMMNIYNACRRDGLL